MLEFPSESTRIYSLLFLLTLLSPPIAATTAVTTTAVKELLKGFTATPDSSVKSFQPLLSDSAGNYSLGFLRVDQTQLALAIVHVQSQEQIWIAGKSPLTRWSSRTRLTFNGSIVIWNEGVGVVWSSYTDGDRVRLSDTSNLLIERVDNKSGASDVLWQSFDFPYNTLMENQNFTSAMTLVSANGVYSMQLGPDFIGFYAKFVVNSGSGLDSKLGLDSGLGELYYKHNPMEAKAPVVKGQGPIRVVLSPNGYLSMYQNGTDPVDVQPFSSFQQPGTGSRRVRLEPDGNLIGYYWAWARSAWLVDFKQINDPCDLPSSCGPYGLCHRGKGCSCLDIRKTDMSGQCKTEEIRSDRDGDDLCRSKYKVLRRVGIELPNKEIQRYTVVSSLEKCENMCEQNCTCWGAVYSNTSGFCYTIHYPIQTVVEVLDDTKAGYFKVREGAGNGYDNVTGLWVGLGMLLGLLVIMLGVGGVILCRRDSRGVKGYVEEEGLSGGVGPYKNLGSNSSKSIELSER